MGVDHSTRHSLNDWKTDPLIVFETDRWKVNDGILEEGTRISVFEAKDNVEQKESLERLAKHLRTLRHPCIVKHLLTCKRKGHLHLVTEQVIPLEILLLEKKTNIVETIAGLYNILQALHFLHTTCGLKHNGVCTSSVFVCANGCWKLAGFEWTDEVKTENTNNIHEQDVYAFAQFALHLLAEKEELASMPGGEEFCQRLTKDCLGPPAKRPSCIDLSNDPIFKNDFLDIRSFLQNLVLKTADEKEQFYSTLIPRLSKLNPELVARHLSHLLLCRLVFLDSSAVKYLLPSILRPQTEDIEKNLSDESIALLPVPFYQKYIIPQLLCIFCVRSRHVRLVLLNHFSHYVHLFTKEELSNVILPQVLLGVRDTNDEIVSATLEALAKLVILLGARVVIGGSQQKLFTEATPSKKKQPTDSLLSTKKNKTSRDKRFSLSTLPTPAIPNPAVVNQVTDYPLASPQVLERSSPDGGESLEGDDDDNDNTWSDWETESNSVSLSSSNLLTKTTASIVETESAVQTKPGETMNKKRNSIVSTGLGEEFDIMALNISVKSSCETRSAEDDFFLDMEPTIMPTIIVDEDLISKKTTNGNDVKEQSSWCDPVETLESGWDDAELHVDWTD